MTNKLTVPSELIHRAIDAIEQVGYQDKFIDYTFVRAVKQELRAALADPVPPAGGDVEVIAWLYDDGEGTRGVTDRWDVAKHTPSVVAQLVDRANVTRLQAEVEDLRRRCTHVNSQLVATKFELEETRGAYLNQSSRLVGSESELTKAREFARRYQWLRAGGDRPSGDKYTLLAGYEHEDATGYDRNTYQLTGEELDAAVDLAMGADWHDKADIAVSNQSAPADKGGDS